MKARIVEHQSSAFTEDVERREERPVKEPNFAPYHPVEKFGEAVAVTA